QTLVQIPRERFEELANAPLLLANAEAAEMLGRGDARGASQRIAAGVAQAAEIRAQYLPQQSAAPAAPAAPPSPQPTDEEKVRAILDARLAGFSPFQKSMMPPQIRRDLIERARQDAGVATDPRFDMSRPFLMAPPRPKH